MKILDFRSELVFLQREQAAHDLRAHADVLNWSLDKRLRHYTLHLGKYLAELSKSTPEPRVLLDTFIITLALANALEMNLADVLDLDFYESRVRIKDPQEQKLELFGKMCKLAESWDHKEDLPYDQMWREVTALWLHSLLRWVEQTPYSIPEKIRNRWIQVEHHQSRKLFPCSVLCAELFCLLFLKKFFLSKSPPLCMRALVDLSIVCIQDKKYLFSPHQFTEYRI